MDPNFSADSPHSSSVASELASADLSPYAVKLNVFEGPLDLLLHLIKINEVDITDIPIARVAEQYLDYLALMHELNLEVAGEYLLMAATLAWIKSRMLLPPDPDAVEEEEGDPRAMLVARLLEYQRFKEVAAEIGDRLRLGRDIFEVRGAEPDRPEESAREIEIGALDLFEALRRVLKEAERADARHELSVETVSVREQMIMVMNTLADVESAEFSQLLREPDGRVMSRIFIVATFLAILELSRLRALRTFQALGESGAPEGPIRLRRIEDSGVNWMHQIAEIM